MLSPKVQGVWNDGFHPKMFLLISCASMYQNYLFLVGIGPIRDKELIFIFLSVPFVCTFV